MSTSTVHAAYRDVLASHLARRDESVLLEAYELGRQMMDDGLGVLDVVRIHHETAAALASELDAGPPDGAPAPDAVAELLNEILAPFEMAYRGFQEANASLRELAATLEQRVADKTDELRSSMSALQAADAERRHLLARIVTAQEEERRRIAEDIHDDSVQTMAAVGLHLAALRAKLEGAVEPQRLEVLEQSVTQAVARLRSLMFELRPPELDRAGLAAALRRYLEETGPDAGLTCELRDMVAREPRLEVREVLYRIAQEALVNVRKHAAAQFVTVTLADRDDGVLVQIVDDGTGFDPATQGRSRAGHMGITAMRERAAMAGGWCRIFSAPGEGTTVEFWAPSNA